MRKFLSVLVIVTLLLPSTAPVLANGGGGGNTEIHANINVDGNVTDQKWFAEQLVKQRNIIAASIAKVDRERPSAQRRNK